MVAASDDLDGCCRRWCGQGLIWAQMGLGSCGLVAVEGCCVAYWLPNASQDRLFCRLSGETDDKDGRLRGARLE
jgi:hypothetical protein